jgi:hypothetical protein
VSELELLRARGRAVKAADVLAVLEQMVERLERYERLFDALEARLLLVDALPADAPFGALIRLRKGTVAERLPLYLGNGAGQPLTKLLPVAL